MHDKKFKILGIEHIGIAVEDFKDLSLIFSDILGLDSLGSEEVKDQNIITEIYDTGRGKLEFLKATNEISTINQFIHKKGHGIHHIALIVDNLNSAIEYLKDRNIKLIDEKPKIGAEGFLIAFIHPKSTGGILIELCEKKPLKTKYF